MPKQLETIVYAALRIVAGAMFSLHGMQKLFGWWIEKPPEMFSQFWIGGVIELVCGILIAIGLFTRVAAFLASGQMAVAYFQFHWKLQFDRNILPVNNHGDDSVLYCFVFLLICVRGAGAAAVDNLLGRK
jgi:putative oxidoreductase